MSQDSERRNYWCFPLNLKKKETPSKIRWNGSSRQISIVETGDEFIWDFELSRNSDYPYSDKAGPTCIQNQSFIPGGHWISSKIQVGPGKSERGNFEVFWKSCLYLSGIKLHA